MNKTKHTPGPWTVNRATLQVRAEYTSGGETSFDIIAELPAEYATESECEANAALIAAAPDLLEAAIACAEYSALTWSDDPDNEPGFFKDLRDAIAKAEGGIK